MDAKIVNLPLTEEAVKNLHMGDRVLLNGTVYTGRDEAHLYICRMLDSGEALPFELKDSVIYYTGPCPAAPGQVIGSAGPTTSGRMDAFSPRLISLGLRGMIGKGPRKPEVIEAMKEYGCVYFAATGGAGALLSDSIKEAEVIAFPELGAEAVYRLRVEGFPCTVAIDCYGMDIYSEGRKEYALK